MNILRYSILIFCLSLGAASFAKEKEYADEFFYERVSKIRDAQARDDFDALASSMHEKALAYYRRILLMEIDALKKQYTDAEIREIIGMDQGQMSLLTDHEFFIALSRSIQPGAGNAGEVVYLGVVRDGADVFHVLYRYKVKGGEGGDEIAVLRPAVLSFRRSGDDVRLWSIVSANSAVLELRKSLALLRDESRLSAVD